MNRWLRALAALLALALSTAAGWAEGAKWSADRPVACGEDLPGCRLLQMVMMGCFDAADPDDAVLERVLACVYPRLAEITEADLAHFAAEFDEDTDAARRRWYDAMANCLRADIEFSGLSVAGLDAARRVLALFLSPAADPDAEEQKEQIRSGMTDAVLDRIAGAVAAPVDFVRYVIGDYAPQK